MRQTLHILKKDVRHFWREIALSFALLAVFVWMGPKLWRYAGLGAVSSYGSHAYFGTSLVESLLLLLIPISWWLLIARTVHEERLVGDRQFWITRPYEWEKLLAAKTLFIACFVWLPLAIAQWWLLAVAGLHPAGHIGALLYDWLLITAIFILPLAALATVTRNFARMTLTLLGVLVAGVALVSVVSTMLQSGMMHSPVGNIDRLDVPLLVAFCSAVVLLSYARRRIDLGRILLLVLPVLLFLSQQFLSTDAMVNHTYPAGSAGIQFALRDNPMDSESAHPALSRKELLIKIPLHVDGIAPGDLWMSNGARVTVESGGRALWTSNWRPVSNQYITADKDTFLTFSVSREVFYRLQSQPVMLHVELALDQAHRAKVEKVNASLADITVNGLGVCTSVLQPGRPDAVTGKTSLQIVGLNCRSALRAPQLTYVETALTDGPCESNKSVINEFLPQPLPRGVWMGNLTENPSELSIAPVDVAPLNFLEYDERSLEFRKVCPGSPITFTRYSLVRHMRTDFTVENFRFPSYDEREDAAR